MEKKRKKLPLLIGLSLLAVILSIQQYKIYNLKKEENLKQEELKEIVQETEILNKRLNNQEDITYIEKIARDDYNMIRPGEIIYEDIGIKDQK